MAGRLPPGGQGFGELEESLQTPLTDEQIRNCVAYLASRKKEVHGGEKLKRLVIDQMISFFQDTDKEKTVNNFTEVADRLISRYGRDEEKREVVLDEVFLVLGQMLFSLGVSSDVREEVESVIRERLLGGEKGRGGGARSN